MRYLSAVPAGQIAALIGRSPTVMGRHHTRRDHRRRAIADVNVPSRSAGGRSVVAVRSDRVLFQCLLAPGEEIVPSKEPVVEPVAEVAKRSIVKLPVAPANRPVPPVMVPRS
jgi:hypothetical protein